MNASQRVRREAGNKSGVRGPMRVPPSSVRHTELLNHPLLVLKLPKRVVRCMQHCNLHPMSFLSKDFHSFRLQHKTKYGRCVCFALFNLVKDIKLFHAIILAVKALNNIFHAPEFLKIPFFKEAENQKCLSI